MLNARGRLLGNSLLNRTRDGALLPAERFQVSSGQEEPLIFVSEELDACSAAPLDACVDLVCAGGSALGLAKPGQPLLEWEVLCQVP